MKQTLRKPIFLFGLGILIASPVRASLTDCATSWSNFNNPGYISEYTSQGQVIGDEETSADSTHGPAAVQPADADLASGSPGAFPGPEATSFFGYYNGGTVYDPNDPVTMQDDYILFRMRVEGNPNQGGAFGSRHWNVLFDVDNDGYKEYWVDLDGTLSSGPGNDRLQILYDNSNRQDIPDPDAARVDQFTAYYSPDGNPACGGGSPGLSHTQVIATNDGTGDYWIEMQIPMTAFVDDLGNQVLYPDSPISFVFSTGASNQDPLQKDFMQDLDFLTLSDPITFGDTIIPNGQPRIDFTDSDLEPVNFYSVGEDVFIYLTDPTSNTDASTVECINVTVTDPSTGDDESVTLCESGPNTGIFTNRGGICSVNITNPSPAPSPATAWLTGLRSSSTTIDEDWTLTYNAATTDWTVVGSVSGVQSTTASHGVAYATDGGELSFTLYEDAANLTDGTVLSTCTRGADPLPTSSAGGTDDDGTLQVFSGDDIYVSYTNANFVTVTDTVPIVGVCEAFVSFTRATGLPSSNFTLAADPLLSDQLYVTVFHAEANTDPAVAETITVVLSGNDTQTLTLTETGVDTGEFRNSTGLQTQIDDGTVTSEDNLWEDVDLGTVTATYSYSCGGSAYNVDTQASLFTTGDGGRVQFTNGAGTLDVDLYTAAQPVWLKVTDPNACTTASGTLDVTVTSPVGDSETITLTETFPGSGVFMNRTNDLVTTAGSAVVTSLSSTFQADGVQAGDTFAIATGPDIGTYTVASVDSETQITLTTTLSTSRTNISFNAMPLMTATNDGSIALDDDLLEADHSDTLTVSYADCDDGDADSTNNIKIDTAVYNAPSLLINEVLFYPDTAPTSCQTEAVELYNSSAFPITATGYTITDEDGFSYTVPQLGGSDIVLQPGEYIYLSLWDGSPAADFFLTDTYYLFTTVGATMPSDQFADPANTDPADQITLFDTGGIAVDYVGWSSTLTPSLDFYSDDSPAVLRSIWQDDAFMNAAGIALASAIGRSSDGFDTNSPSDWGEIANNTCTIIITRAFISSFRAFREGGHVVAEWETSSESGTVGFYLYRFDSGSGRYVRVNDELLPGLLESPQGGIYRLVDRGASGESLTYVLMEVESSVSGTKPLFHGPYTVVPDEAGLVPYRVRGSSRESIPRGLAMRELRRLEDWKAETRAERKRVRAVRGRTKLKIAVEQDGLYALEARQIAPAFGLSLDQFERALRKKRFRLTNEGRPVAWTPSDDGSAILFWGESVESIYTKENVYWLQMRPGLRMKNARTSRKRRSEEPGSFFWHTMHAEEEMFAATVVATDPESDFWHWSFLVSGDPNYSRQTLTLNVEELVDVAADAVLAVHLVGATSASGGALDDHHVRVKVNGHVVGDGRFGHIGPYTLELTFDASYLREGDNVVELEGILDTGAPFSIVYIDAFDLTYPRSYRASGSPFVFAAGGNAELAVRGFAGPDVMLLDITNPRLPRVVRRAQLLEEGESYGLQFRASSPQAIYAAIGSDQWSTPKAIWLDEPSSLRKRRNSADYLVIAPSELHGAAERLVEHRRRDGLDAEVVLLEDVYDEFSGGVITPHAIRDFLAHAHKRWSRSPRFVVLAGAGNMDYKDHLELGGNVIPPLLASTPDGLYASDNRFADVDGDGWPDLAIGRIPVVTAAELDAYVAKLQLHESSGSSLWSHGLMLVADEDAWTPGTFARDSESMAGVIPPFVPAERNYLMDQIAADARARLLAALSAGTPLVNYVGHGGLDRLANELLLHTSDVPALGSGGPLSIVTGFSCNINRFELFGFQSLGEALTVEPDGGAVAVWASSGHSVDLKARGLGNAFFSSVFRGRSPTLGEAILNAFETYRVGQGDELMPRIYNLLGDPAVPLN